MSIFAYLKVREIESIYLSSIYLSIFYLSFIFRAQMPTTASAAQAKARLPGLCAVLPHGQQEPKALDRPSANFQVR